MTDRPLDAMETLRMALDAHHALAKLGQLSPLSICEREFPGAHLKVRDWAESHDDVLVTNVGESVYLLHRDSLRIVASVEGRMADSAPELTPDSLRAGGAL